MAQQTFLRGIQISNASGEVVFTTIYPGWYQGRATHIHAEVSVNGRSVASDGIFADSLAAELVTPVGSAAAGYTAAFQIGVAL